ncbi:hypothetical protein KC333_g8528 [Hortaea werneckii]|nr:hypothetical protein KC333_g8528 [Hortaea werneckii]KAI7311071.1 hypothetical protein KC326_g6415 [Hortaea werneckii]
MKGLMQALNLAYNNQSVANFKTFLNEILSSVPEYTNLKGREARNKAPSHMEIQGVLDTQDAAVARRVTTPIAQLSAEEVRSLGKVEIFARLARYITERLEPRRERDQDALLDQDPTFSDTYRSHAQPDQAKFKLVIQLIGWINKQFYAKGIYFQGDASAQALIRPICDAYTQQPNVGNVDVRDDIAARVQYFFPASPDLGDHVILRTERDFPTSLNAFKDRLYALFRFDRQRIVIIKLVCHSAEVPANEREVSRDEQWAALMNRNLDLYHFAVIHTYNPTYGQPGDPSELGYIPTMNDQIGSFPAVMDKARQLTAEAQAPLINRARTLLARHTQEAADFVVEQAEQQPVDALRSEREYRRQELTLTIDDQVTRAQAVSRNEIEEFRSLLSDEKDFASEQAADAYLRRVTGLKDLAPVAQLPRRRMLQNNQPVAGVVLKPHQKTGLAKLLDNEATIGGSVLSDTMGLGKTAQYMALMIAGNVAERYRARSNHANDCVASGINAVVVPAQLAALTTDTLHDELGVQWKVYRLGKHKQPYTTSTKETRIKIGRREKPWSDTEINTPPIEQRVLVMTYEQLSILDNEKLKGNLIGDDLLESSEFTGLFRRIVFDEGHAIRRFEETLRGRNMRRFSPRYRLVVTGTPILRTARDLRGYVATMERADWLREDIDRNEEYRQDGELDENGRYNRYLAEVDRCKREDRLPDESLFQDDGDSWRPNVRGRRGCRDDDRAARDRLLNTGVVTEFPATLFYNTHRRRRSVPRKERFMTTWPVDANVKLSEAELKAGKKRQSEERSDDFPLPFGGECPFDTYSKYDRNKVRCLTVQAFNAWIEPHLVRWEKQQDERSLTIASDRLRVIYDLLFVSRNAQTTMRTTAGNEVAVGGDIPQLHLRRVKVHFTEQEQEWYREYEDALGQEINVGLGIQEDVDAEGRQMTMRDLYPEDYLDAGAEDGDAPAEVQSQKKRHYRSSVIPLISHLGFHALRKRTTPQWQEQKDRTLAHFVYELRKCRALDLDQEEDPFSSDVAVLEQALKGAAPLNKAVVDLWDVIHNSPEGSNKGIGYCTSPRTVEVLNKILLWMGIPTVVLRSSDKPDYRNDLITKYFNSGNEHCVLLAPLTLRIAGWNLHPRSHNVIFVEEPPSLPLFEQAMFRIRRLGQRFEQRVVRYFVPGTYHVNMEKRMLDRAIQIEMVINDYLHSRDANNVKMNDEASCKALATEYCVNSLGLIAERDDGQI